MALFVHRLPAGLGGLKQLIDSLQATSLLRVGAQYNLDSLTLERKRISQLLRNRGYYYFRPEYMEYLADTTAGRRQVALRLNLRPNVPQAALMPYRVGDVTVRLTNIKPGPADTLRLPDATVIARRPLKIRPRVLSRALTLRPGQLFTVDAQNRTQTDLNKLGIFRSVNLSVTRSTRCAAPTRSTWRSTPGSTTRWRRPWRPTSPRSRTASSARASPSGSATTTSSAAARSSP